MKSCVLLAGLYADDGPTVVVEQGAQTRDHTERHAASDGGARAVEPAAGGGVARASGSRRSRSRFRATSRRRRRSSSLRRLLSGSELRIHGVNLNPTRTGLLDVLERMGARIAVFNRRSLAGEPAGDLEVRSADLTATTVTPEEVPSMIDELPLFALAAGMARGESRVEGAQELRAKESNRIETRDNFPERPWHPRLGESRWLRGEGDSHPP